MALDVSDRANFERIGSIAVVEGSSVDRKRADVEDNNSARHYKVLEKFNDKHFAHVDKCVAADTDIQKTSMHSYENTMSRAIDATTQMRASDNAVKRSYIEAGKRCYLDRLATQRYLGGLEAKKERNANKTKVVLENISKFSFVLKCRKFERKQKGYVEDLAALHEQSNDIFGFTRTQIVSAIFLKWYPRKHPDG